MSYRVALIQNESEMLRFSHSDIRPTLQKYNYEWTYYTAENINQLFKDILRYDAIVLATNVCNDEIVTQALTDNKETIDRFLSTPRKGMLIAFQMRLTDNVRFERYPFLPERFGVKGCYRFESNESANEGSVVIEGKNKKHVILNHPNRIDIDDVKTHCLTNPSIKGLYWGYLSPITGNFDILVKDSSYDDDRPLLLVAHEDARVRLVVSSLVLDWQLHDRLWENTLRYVVEGRHFVGIIKKRDNISIDLEYLKAVLSVKKISYDVYGQGKLNLSRIPLDVHTVLIFDPLFSSDEIKDALSKTTYEDLDKLSVFFFESWLSANTVLNVVGGTRDFDTIAKNCTAWLKSLYNDSFWEGSFWRSVDILGTLHYFDEPIMAYQDGIVKSIAKKRTPSGTYDNVFGATCAMLLVYYWFNQKDTEKFKSTLNWIISELERTDIFNKATAIEIISFVAPEMLTETTLTGLRNSIISKLSEFSNQLELLRFSSALLQLGFNGDAEKVVKKLLELQDNSGNVNLYSIAETTFVLIGIVNKSENPDPVLQGRIFIGIQQLRENYNSESFNWKDNAITSAKALKTLKAFEEMISFPVDDLLSFLTDYEYKDRHYVAIDTVTLKNQELMKKLYESQQELESAQNKFDVQSKFFRKSKIAILTILPIFYILLLITVVYGFEQLGIFDKVVGFTSKWQDMLSIIVIPILIFIPLTLYVYLLAKFSMIPGHLKPLLEKVFKFKV